MVTGGGRHAGKQRVASHARLHRVSVVLADHRHLARHAVRCLLEARLRFTVVAEVSDPLKIPRVIGRFHPAVVVVDLHMQPVSGADVALTLRRKAPDIPVVVLADSTSETQLIQCLRNGASGYVTDVASPEELMQAIDAVARGARYISSPFSNRPIGYWLERAQEASPDPYDSLTSRERQILHVVADGLSGTVIAQRLGISKRTVESHREHLKDKLGIRSHPGLIRYVVERQASGLDAAGPRS